MQKKLKSLCLASELSSNDIQEMIYAISEKENINLS